MNNIYSIIQELNADNGSNYKMDVLRKHASNVLLQRVLKMTYDKVTFTYGITANTWDVNDHMIGSETSGMGSFDPDSMDLASALDIITEYFAERKFSGHDARDAYRDLLYACNPEDAAVVMGIINRDLRINMGRSNINKVFKGLIVKPVYMRCGLYSDKTAKKINPQGAFVQLKADGTYREFTVVAGEVSCNSRSGEEYDYPVLYKEMSSYPDGKYIGELTVIVNGVLQDRATGNGLINSDSPPHNDIYLDAWDYVTLDEYNGAANKVKGTTPYAARFARLGEIVSDQTGNVRIIETHIVDSFADALQKCSAWMTAGFEGAILKDKDAIFRDGTSPQQLKLKLEIDAEVRVTGFIEGTPGTKRESTFGSITFATDDGTIKGSCSGFNDTQLEDFNSRREELVGQVFTVQFNDITKGRDNDYHALSHPRFVEFRTDKDETDTLERVLKSKNMAMCIGDTH